MTNTVLTIREVHQNILIKQQVDVKQKCWQNLLCGASFINGSNSLQWYVLPQAFETNKLGLWLAGRTTDTGFAVNSCPCPPGSCLTPHGWGQAGRHRRVPVPGQMRMSEMLPFIHSFPALCQREVLWGPPHPSRWKEQCLGSSWHSHSWLRLAEAAVGCQRERSGWGKCTGDPGKPHPLSHNARCICGCQGKGPPSPMQAQRQEEAAFQVCVSCKCIWWSVFMEDVIDASNLCWSPSPNVTVFGDGPPEGN